MRYDAAENLTRTQRLWMILDDPSFSRGARLAALGQAVLRRANYRPTCRLAAAFWYAQISLSAILISTVSFCLETEYNCKMIDKVC